MNDRDKALIEHVMRGVLSDALISAYGDAIRSFAAEVLKLERSGWQPPVDPDVLAVREILAEMDRTAHGLGVYGDRETAQRLLAGEYDNDEPFQAALAAYRKHKGASNG